MKFLLVGVNAKYIHSCLAVHSIKAYVKHNIKQADISVVEYTINQRLEDVVSDIYLKKPDFVGFSCYLWNIEFILKILDEIKILLPDCKIWLGGPEVSFNSQDRLRDYTSVSGIIIGEGEGIVCDLINHYENNVELDDIKGIAYRIDDVIKQNELRDYMDFNEVPFAYDYVDDMSDFDNRIIYYESSRGCPFGCSYCLSSVEKSLRFRTVDKVKRELQFFLDRKVPQVKFVDRTFNCDHKRTVELLNFIKEHDNGVTNFHFEVAGDILTSEECQIISTLRKGLIQLEIGVQSTNAKTLDAINRRTDMVKLRENVAILLKAQNVHLHLDLIAGLPYEDINSFKNSFNEVYDMGGHELQLGFLKMLFGAPISEVSKEHGIIARKYPPYEVIKTELLSYEDILLLKNVEEMLEIYHNSEQFEYSEKHLLKLENSPFDMYKNLAEFYVKKNYPIIMSSRMKRYDILLEYYAEAGYTEIELFKELLTLDFYKRENAKSRPLFAPKQNFRALKEFYEESENIEKYLPDYIGQDRNVISRITHLEDFQYFENGKRVVFDYRNNKLIFI